MSLSNRDRAEMAVAYGILYGKTPDQIVDMLDADGLLMPAPQIIRTVEELEALDPETPIWSRNAGYLDVAEFLNAIEYDIDYADDLPAVVVLPAEQVRAAREALEEA